jgi:imidazoleglycerol-phosphate dehydratase
MKRRRAAVRRSTRETRVRAAVVLDGHGTASVRLGDRWYEHMLETFARFAGFDVTVEAVGDLGHHIVEDAAITLGRAFRDAIAGRPVERMGSATIVMDDAMVTAAVDLVQRPFVDVSLPDEMLEHLIRSFAMEARITVHVLVHRGRDPHHVNEAAMKALGRALRDAVRPGTLPMSTKGEPRWTGPKGRSKKFR